MTKSKKADFWLVVGLVMLAVLLVFTVYPMARLLTIAFKAKDGSFTLDYFKEFFSKPYYYSTIGNSFKVAVTDYG